VALLALIAGTLLFGRLGAPLLEPEEARYAEIPRQMLAEGRLLTPVLHGEAYYHKPPLLYWLVMAAYGVFGVQDWAARLVPATAGVLIVLVSYAWGRRAAGRWAGLFGAGILALSAKFLYQAGMLTFDSLTALCVVASLAAAHRALDRARLARGWWLGAGLACGLGVLAKGPVALLLVMPPLAVWQFLDRRPVRVSGWMWASFAAVALGVAAPWFGVTLWRDPQALADFFWTHNLRRYLDPLDHEEPVWFYVLPVVIGMLPWSLALIPLVRHLGRRSARAARRRPAALGFFLLASLWCFAFFSLSGCKRQGYMIPALPPLALAVGTYLANAIAWPRVTALVRLHPAWNLAAHRATLVTLGLGAAIGGAAVLRDVWAWPTAVAWSGTLLAALLFMMRHGPSPSAGRTGAVCGATTFLLLLVAVHQLLPDYYRLFALRSQVSPQRELAAGLPVASYPKRWDSVSFYLKRDDVVAYSPERRAALIDDLRQQGRTLLFVKRGAALDDLLRALPGDLEFVPRGRPGAIVVPGVVQVKTK